MKKLDVPYQRMKPGRYASELRKLVRTHEPKRKLDLMIVHALIEARSCERFRLLAKRLPQPCAICTSSSSAPRRGTSSCISTSRSASSRRGRSRERLELIATREAELATSADVELRFPLRPRADMQMGTDPDS